ncbi:Protein CBG28077 [Caenorhabditis briggsae]|uniref:Protein CBG28077 n=1 Tax=Caenorhabditis briggsae TaxID=6238 RepID=B6IGR7_CAEBR|nr:Protein CBG28077 [Caenorhabditis briggsae]CAR99097.1 Protein CBG28077 [Caenorhabditis briggsae]
MINLFDTFQPKSFTPFAGFAAPTNSMCSHSLSQLTGFAINNFIAQQNLPSISEIFSPIQQSETPQNTSFSDVTRFGISETSDKSHHLAFSNTACNTVAERVPTVSSAIPSPTLSSTTLQLDNESAANSQSHPTFPVINKPSAQEKKEAHLVLANLLEEIPKFDEYNNTKLMETTGWTEDMIRKWFKETRHQKLEKLFFEHPFADEQKARKVGVIMPDSISVHNYISMREKLIAIHGNVNFVHSRTINEKEEKNVESEGKEKILSETTLSKNPGDDLPTGKQSVKALEMETFQDKIMKRLFINQPFMESAPIINSYMNLARETCIAKYLRGILTLDDLPQQMLILEFLLQKSNQVSRQLVVNLAAIAKVKESQVYDYIEMRARCIKEFEAEQRMRNEVDKGIVGKHSSVGSDQDK